MIRRIRAHEQPVVEDLLTGAGLPVNGLGACLDNVYVHETAGRITGAIGLERYGEYGLLRSAVVHANSRGIGVGRALTRHLLERARAERIQELFLLTTTAEAFFARFGFRGATREEVPPVVRNSVEFRVACPASATVMRLALE